MTLEGFLKVSGKKIAGFRKAQSLHQKEAAQRVGISYRYYQSIETGRANITLSTLLRLAEFYKIHPCEIMPEKLES